MGPLPLRSGEVSPESPSREPVPQHPEHPPRRALGSEAVLDIAARQRMQHTERAQRDGPAIARARTLPRGVEDGHFVRLAAMTGEIDTTPPLSGLPDLRRRHPTQKGRAKPEH